MHEKLSLTFVPKPQIGKLEAHQIETTKDIDNRRDELCKAASVLTFLQGLEQVGERGEQNFAMLPRQRSP